VRRGVSGNSDVANTHKRRLTLALGGSIRSLRRKRAVALLDVVRNNWRSSISELRRYRQAFVVFVVAWFFIKFISGLFMLLPGPWGPRVTGRLPGGRTVVFQSRFYGRETDDVLIVKEMSGLRDNWYWINNAWNAKITFVRIAISEKKELIWIESGGQVLASLDLSNDNYVRASLPGVEFGSGETLAMGHTRGWWQYVVPW
jgi:hypothetical protein